MTRPVVPWYNEDIDQAKRTRRKAERKWRRTRLPSDFEDYEKKRNYATNLMNKARQEFYTHFVEENSSNQKKLFNAANKLVGERKQLRFPEHINKTVLANDIGRYFVRKIERLRTDIDSIHLHPQDQDQALSERNVSDLINNSAKKSCVLDPMPTCLIYDSLDVLLPVIGTLSKDDDDGYENVA